MIEIEQCHGTKGDLFHKQLINEVLTSPDRSVDREPRAKWADGTPAHATSINCKVGFDFRLKDGESALSTVRLNAWKTALGEILWIYRDQDNNVYNLETKYGVRWWRSWVVNPYHYDRFGKLQPGPNPYEGFYYDAAGHLNKVIRGTEIGEKSPTVDPVTDMDENKNIIDYETGNVLTPDATLGHTYGQIIRECFSNPKYVLECIRKMVEMPDDRRNIMNMMQVKELAKGTILPPCAYETQWFIAYGEDGIRYVDMRLIQRSLDLIAAGVVNPVQYSLFEQILANEVTRITGIPHVAREFIWLPGNVQIYNRHEDIAREILAREPIDCAPYFEIAKDVPFKDMKVSDVTLHGMPEKGKIKALSRKIEIAK